MKQLRFPHTSIFAIPRSSLAFVTGTAVLAFLLAAPAAAIGQVALGSTPQAGVSGSSPPASSADAVTGDVSFQDGLLSVSAEGADLVALLAKISKATGVPIEIHEGVSGSVTIFFARLAPEEGITRILDAVGSRNMLATFEAPTPGSGGGTMLRKISVLSKAADTTSPRDPRRFDFATNLEALKRHIEARYGKGALREDIVRRNSTNDTIQRFVFCDRGVSSRVTDENAQQYAKEKIREFATFISVAPEQVVRMGVHKGPLMLTVNFAQAVASVPVEGTTSAVEIVYRDEGNLRADLVYLTQWFHPSIPISTTPTLTPEQAAQLGAEAHRKAFPVWNFMLDQKRYEDAEEVMKTPRHPPELVILPMGIPERDPARYEYYLAYKIGYLPQTYYIDAQTGKVIRAISHVQRSTETMRRVP